MSARFNSAEPARALVPVSIRHAEAIVNAGLVRLLADCPHVRLVEASEDAAVILTDYADAMARLSAARPDVARLVIVSQREREWEVRAAMMAGVDGYLPQRCDADELHHAMRALAQGRRYFNKELLERAMAHLGDSALTVRESQVLGLLATGCCNKRIALTLDIGVGTVKTHIKSLLGKLGARARTHAVVLATQRGMLADLLS